MSDQDMLECAGRAAFHQLKDGATSEQFLAKWEQWIYDLAPDRRYKLHVGSMSCGSVFNFSAIVRYRGAKYYAHFERGGPGTFAKRFRAERCFD